MIREKLFSYFAVVHILSMKCVMPQEPVVDLTCDPLNVGTPPGTSNLIRAAANANPNACLCADPCTVEKVSQLIRLYSIKSGQTSYHELDYKNPKSSELFNYTGHVKFLTHGYSNNGTVGFVPITGAQLIKVFEGYVITVDWGAISNCTVNQTTFGITPSVGYFLADVIRNFNLNPRKIELIGRSVGGQIIGYTGAALNGTIARITALDPAFRLFDQLNIGLNKSCAEFVQVLSTNPGGYGTAMIRGHAQFFANKRSIFQPGCNTTSCSHTRSGSVYYASLFGENKLIGVDCSLTDIVYVDSSCLDVPYLSRFGQYNDGKNGVFCFETTPCFPYAREIVYQKVVTTEREKGNTSK